MTTKKVTVDLTDNEFLTIARMAHEQDITFNAMCIKILEEQLDKLDVKDKPRKKKCLKK
jgi:hypothetical protein